MQQTKHMYLATDILWTIVVGAVTEGRRFGRKTTCREISGIDWVKDSRRINCAIKGNTTLLNHKMKDRQGISKTGHGRRLRKVEGLYHVPTNYQRCSYDIPEKSEDSDTPQRTTNVVRRTNIDGRRPSPHLSFEGLSIICQYTWRVSKK